MSIETFSLNTIAGIHIGFVAIEQENTECGILAIKAQAIEEKYCESAEFKALSQLSEQTLTWKKHKDFIEISSENVAGKIKDGYLHFQGHIYRLENMLGV